MDNKVMLKQTVDRFSDFCRWVLSGRVTLIVAIILFTYGLVGILYYQQISQYSVEHFSHVQQDVDMALSGFKVGMTLSQPDTLTAPGNDNESPWAMSGDELDADRDDDSMLRDSQYLANVPEPAGMEAAYVEQPYDVSMANEQPVFGRQKKRPTHSEVNVDPRPLSGVGRQESDGFLFQMLEEPPAKPAKKAVKSSEKTAFKMPQALAQVSNNNEGPVFTDNTGFVPIDPKALSAIESGRDDPFAPLVMTGEDGVQIMDPNSDVEADPFKDIQFTGVIQGTTKGNGSVAIVRVNDPSAGSLVWVRRQGDSFDLDGEKVVIRKIEPKRLLLRLNGENRYIDLNEFVDNVTTTASPSDAGFPAEGGAFDQIEELP